MAKQKKESFISVWRRFILDKLKCNLSTYPPYRNYNFYANANATMSGKELITYYYTIDGYPANIPIDFRDVIRSEARDGIRVSFVSTFEPTRVDWGSPQMRSKIKTWKTIESSSDDVDAYNYRETINLSDSMVRRKESLIYLSDAEIRRKRNLFKYRTLMVVSGSRGENFDKTIAEINSYCSRIGIIITRVDNHLFSFLRAFSPFSLELTGDILREVGNNTITDEQLARFSTYDQGKIGKDGLLWGTDIYSGFPVYKMLKRRDTDAENILITAETGGGKSFFLKFLLLQLVAMPEMLLTINDIEGFEYIPFAGFVANQSSVVILNMAEGQGCYFDPFEIKLTGIEDLDDDMFNLCSGFTSSIFRTLVGSELAVRNEWGANIIANAVTKAYADLGVSMEDKSTWSRTRGRDLFYVYSKFKDLYMECLKLRKGRAESLELHQRYKLNEGYMDALDKIVAKLSEYFEFFANGGIHSNVFKERVSLDDVVNAKIVICSFGMSGKSFDNVDPTQMALAMMSAASISHLRSLFGKAKGKYSVKVWEEFQRFSAYPNSTATIKTAVTGGRKLGDINFIITNDVADLLKNDRFAIFDNVKSFAVGAIAKASTRKQLVEELSVPTLLEDLDSLVTKKGNRENSEDSVDFVSMYDKAFLINLDRSISTISKVMLPKYVADSDLFRTGTDLQGGVK